MGILKQFFNNTRKPNGWMGKLMVNGMNQGHAAVSDWGLSYFPDIPVAAHSMVADFGCGGGRRRTGTCQVRGQDHLRSRILLLP